MSTNTKKSKSSEEALEKLRAFINEKGGIVKKENLRHLMWITARFWNLWKPGHWCG